jgi:hypothetical protein
MKPNLSPIINPNITKISPISQTPKVLLQKNQDLLTPKSSSPTLDQSLVSPNKKSLLNPNTLSQKQKNLHDQITKYDFSFKKKQQSDSKKLNKSLLSDLSSKLDISEELLDNGDLESILAFRSNQKDKFVVGSCSRVSQSTLILCLLLRGKLSNEVSFMGSLRKIWGNCLTKNHLKNILKAADYQITSSDQGEDSGKDSCHILIKKLKVKFVQVSLFEIWKLK